MQKFIEKINPISISRIIYTDIDKDGTKSIELGAIGIPETYLVNKNKVIFTNYLPPCGSFKYLKNSESGRISMISPDFTNSPGWTNFSAKRPFISNFKSAFFDGSSLPVYSTIGEIFFFCNFIVSTTTGSGLFILASGSG